MKDLFYFFPKKGLFLIDTSALILDPYSENKRGYKIEDLDIRNLNLRSKRLKYLINKLSNTQNWKTIPEVVQEYKLGINKHVNLLRNIIRIKQTNQVSALENLITREEKILELLSDSDKNITNSLSRIEQRIIGNSLLLYASRIFKGKKGESNKRNTDCKLIAHALLNAKKQKTSIFSHDNSLLATFTYCSLNSKTKLKPTYVIVEKYEGTIPTKEYVESPDYKKCSS